MTGREDSEQFNEGVFEELDEFFEKAEAFYRRLEKEEEYYKTNNEVAVMQPLLKDQQFHGTTLTESAQFDEGVFEELDEIFEKAEAFYCRLEKEEEFYKTNNEVAVMRPLQKGVINGHVDYDSKGDALRSLLRRNKSEFFCTSCRVAVGSLNNIQTNNRARISNVLALVRNFVDSTPLAAVVMRVDGLNVTGVIRCKVNNRNIPFNVSLCQKVMAISTSTHVTDERNFVSSKLMTISIKVSDNRNQLYVTLAKHELSVAYLEVGRAVSGHLTEDISWHRAEINQSFIPSIVAPIFEYSFCKEVSTFRMNIQKEKFALLPTNAIQLSFPNVFDKSPNSWSEAKVTGMERLCSEKCYVRDALKENKSTLMAFFKELKSRARLSDEFFFAGHVPSTTDCTMALKGDASKLVAVFQAGAFLHSARVDDTAHVPESYFKFSRFKYKSQEDYTFYFLSIDSPNRIWLQDSRGEDSLNDMHEKMQEFYSSSSARVLSVGEIGTACCAVFEKQWYRAEVLSHSYDGKVQVLFVDWGNSDCFFVTELKELVSEFRNLPRQAISVSLTGFSTLHEWNEADVGLLKDLCNVEMVNAKIVEGQNGALKAELLIGQLGEKSVNEQFKDLLSANVPTVLHENRGTKQPKISWEKCSASEDELRIKIKEMEVEIKSLKSYIKTMEKKWHHKLAEEKTAQQACICDITRRLQDVSIAAENASTCRKQVTDHKRSIGEPSCSQHNKNRKTYPPRSFGKDWSRRQKQDAERKPKAGFPSLHSPPSPELISPSLRSPPPLMSLRLEALKNRSNKSNIIQNISDSRINSTSRILKPSSATRVESHVDEKTPTQGDELRKLKSNWSSRHPRCATTGAIRVEDIRHGHTRTASSRGHRLTNSLAMQSVISPLKTSKVTAIPRRTTRSTTQALIKSRGTPGGRSALSLKRGVDEEAKELRKINSSRTVL